MVPIRAHKLGTTWLETYNSEIIHQKYWEALLRHHHKKAIEKFRWFSGFWVHQQVWWRNKWEWVPNFQVRITFQQCIYSERRRSACSCNAGFWHRNRPLPRLGPGQYFLSRLPGTQFWQSLVESAMTKFSALGNPRYTATSYCTNQGISNAVMNPSQIKINWPSPSLLWPPVAGRIKKICFNHFKHVNIDIYVIFGLQLSSTIHTDLGPHSLNNLT